MAIRRRRPADPPPLTPAERAYFDEFLRLVVPEDAEDWLPELDRLLNELAKRRVDLRRVLRVIRAGSFAARIERRDADLLTEFRGTWHRDQVEFLHAVQRLPKDLEQLYTRFPYFLGVLDAAGQLPSDPTMLPVAASATWKALRTLLATIERDPVLQLKGTGRARGNQPARAAGRARAQLKAEGVPSEAADTLLRIFGILRQRPA